ncbi:unnamed protein product [Prorocentrum cordatum]|uniref:Uncharacterized protein n=1 Tax=Prorocentrum cordatum TaxID=2364126 RepID=A0ABN9U9L1_9DINO|nr:unnamed protein product [Polarella glacialis]
MLSPSPAHWQWAVLVLLASMPEVRRLAPEAEWPAPPAPEGPSVREIVADTVSELGACQGGGPWPPPGGGNSSEPEPRETGSHAVPAGCVCVCLERESLEGRWLGWALGCVSFGLQLRGWWQRRRRDGAAPELGALPGWNWRVMTPGGNEYEEALDGSQPGPHRLCMLGLDCSPPRLVRLNFHRFTEYPTDEQLARKGVEHFRAQAHAGTPQPPPTDFVDSTGSAVALPAGALRDMDAALVPRAPPGLCWIVHGCEGPDAVGFDVEPVEGVDVGVSEQTMMKQCDGGLFVKCILVKRTEADSSARQVLDQASASARPPAVVEVETGGKGTDTPREDGTGQAPDECRTLRVDYDPRGERLKEWRQVFLECRTESWSDGRVEGPASLLRWMNQAARDGGKPKMWLADFCRDRRIEKSDRVYHELRNLIEVVYIGGTLNQLNMPAL